MFCAICFLGGPLLRIARTLTVIFATHEPFRCRHRRLAVQGLPAVCATPCAERAHGQVHLSCGDCPAPPSSDGWREHRRCYGDREGHEQGVGPRRAPSVRDSCGPVLRRLPEGALHGAGGVDSSQVLRIPRQGLRGASHQSPFTYNNRPYFSPSAKSDGSCVCEDGPEQFGVGALLDPEWSCFRVHRAFIQLTDSSAQTFSRSLKPSQSSVLCFVNVCGRAPPCRGGLWTWAQAPLSPVGDVSWASLAWLPGFHFSFLPCILGLNVRAVRGWFGWLAPRLPLAPSST